MRYRLAVFLVGIVILGAAFTSATVADPGATYLYTNNNGYPANSVTGFVVASDGTLSVVAGSPFMTGATGTRSGGAVPRLAIARDFLYATNEFDASISEFRIDPSTGTLAPLPGFPVSVRSSVSFNAYSIVATPDGKYLLESDPGLRHDNDARVAIAVYRVENDASLVEVEGSPFPVSATLDLTEVGNMHVSSDGRFIVAVGFRDTVAVLGIGEDGRLTPVVGSPFGTPARERHITLDRRGTCGFRRGSRRGIPVERAQRASDRTDEYIDPAKKSNTHRTLTWVEVATAP